MSEETELWLGSQQTYEKAVEANIAMRADAGFKADSSYEEEVLNQIYSTDGPVAIGVQGALVDGSAGWGIYFGQIGYNDIRNALAKAVSDPNIQTILLNVSSGGGAVNGCHETAQLISRVNAIKPVVTYTGSTMCSAAVWLGSQAQYIVANETAIVGSIGVLMVHMDRSEQLKEMGIKATVIRAGTDKALASPYEPLTDKAKEQLQEKANMIYDIFLGKVAEARGVSVATAEKNYGQGREFLGQKALDVGLVDAIGTYEDAFSKAQALCKPKKATVKSMSGGMAASVEGSNNADVEENSSTNMASSVDNSQNLQGTEMTQPLSAEQLAAMAAGVDLDEGQNPVAPTEDVAVIKAELEAVKTELASAVAEAKTSSESLLAATAELEASKDVTSKAMEVVRNSVRIMGVNFNVTKEALAAMSDVEVLAEHARITPMFKEKFKVGGVAATTASVSEDVQTGAHKVHPFFAALTRKLNAK